MQAGEKQHSYNLRSSWGDPRDIATDPSFPAARNTITIKEPHGKLGMVEIRLWRHLMGIAYEELRAAYAKAYQDALDNGASIEQALLAKPPAPIVHQTSVKSLMVTKHKGDGFLRDALEKLQTTLVQVSNQHDTDWESVQLLGKTRGIMNADESGIVDGTVYFQFPDDIQQYIIDPQKYSRIHLRIMYNMTSKYSIRLYELLVGHYKQKNPNVEINIDDLHDYLGTRNKLSLHRPSVFEDKILKLPRDEINAFAPFTMGYIIRKRGRSMTGICFNLMEKNADAKQQTFDLLGGRSFDN